LTCKGFGQCSAQAHTRQQASAKTQKRHVLKRPETKHQHVAIVGTS
jgi:hypothetical protein